MPYDAVKCFWVERTGKWRGTAHQENGAPDVITDYDSKEAADAAKWDSIAPLFKLPDGRLVESNELPPGSIYEGPDYFPRGFDGRTISAVCPDGHHWCIDSKCSNCGKPDDSVHRCWIRDGDPLTGMLTVSKGNDPEKTCSAGGGSILTSKYHGKLEDGSFTAG